MSSVNSSVYYPIFISMDGRHCLVVGGGSIATSKVAGLLTAGAIVRVVSPDLTAELRELRDRGQIEYREGAYIVSDLNGVALVMVATDDPTVSARVAADCRQRGIWVNAADDPANCDFILPSVIRKGKVTLAASTSGASPALARRLREELEEFLNDETAALADLLGEVRRDLLARRLSVASDEWQRAIDGRLRTLLAQQRYEEARSHLLNNLGIQDALRTKT